MRNTKVAKRYAEALSLVKGAEPKKLEEGLQIAESVLTSSTLVQEFFVSPRISIKEKKALLDKFLKDKIDIAVLNLLKMLIDRRRESIISEILEQLVLVNDKKLGRVRAYVLTSRDLIDFAAQDELAKQVSKSILDNKLAFGIENDNAQVLISHKKNPEILGGIIIRIGDYVLDASVRAFMVKWKKGVAAHKMTNDRGWQ